MIRINDDWVIDVDDRNYTLKKDLHSLVKSKSGDKTKLVPAYKVVGYFSTVSGALNCLGEEIIRQKLSGSVNGLQELADAIKIAQEEWRELVKHVTGGGYDITRDL